MTDHSPSRRAVDSKNVTTIGQSKTSPGGLSSRCVWSLLAVVVLTTGCTDSGPDVATRPADQPAQSAEIAAADASPFFPTPAAAQTTVALHASPLVGVWLGQATLNEEALQTQLDALDVPERAQLIRAARAFVSTQMGIEFFPNGALETAVEVQPVGMPVISGQTLGQWRVAGVSGAGFVVETTEQDDAGATHTKETTYVMSADGNRIILQPSVSKALAKCEPLIYLDRQISERPAASMARLNDGPVIR